MTKETDMSDFYDSLLMNNLFLKPADQFLSLA